MEHTSSLSAMKHVAGNKNEPATKGKARDQCFVFLYHKSSREVTRYRWRVSRLLLTQRRNTFAIQRQIKWRMDHAMWMTRLRYLPGPGNIPSPPNASNHRPLFSSVQAECLCQNFQWNQYSKAARLDLSQEKLTQIPVGQGQPPQPHWWDCRVTGLKELEQEAPWPPVTLRSAARRALELGSSRREQSLSPCSMVAFRCSGVCPDSPPEGTGGEPAHQAAPSEIKNQAERCSSDRSRVSPLSMCWQDTRGSWHENISGPNLIWPGSLDTLENYVWKREAPTSHLNKWNGTQGR